MGSTLPDAEKTHATTSRSKHPFKDALLRPKTWKIALTILSIALKVFRVIAKFGEMFE
ncbi:hypothetical protein SAMN05428974_0922 [Sphingopyxis sp. YR583]|nr:hypothetical protein SAMN05428974_0922 [Sphingopyxis sp. YR583]